MGASLLECGSQALKLNLGTYELDCWLVLFGAFISENLKKKINSLNAPDTFYLFSKFWFKSIYRLPFLTVGILSELARLGWLRNVFTHLLRLMNVFTHLPI